MAVATAAGMSVQDFWECTPREVSNVIHGFYEVEKQKQEVYWYIARVMTYDIMCANGFTDTSKLDFFNLPGFPPLEDPSRAPKLTKEQEAALIAKMDDRFKNPDKYKWEELTFSEAKREKAKQDASRR